MDWGVATHRLSPPERHSAVDDGIVAAPMGFRRRELVFGVKLAHEANSFVLVRHPSRHVLRHAQEKDDDAARVIKDRARVPMHGSWVN